MDLYFDLNRGHFVTANGTSDQVTALRMKRGDTVQVIVRFCRGITLVELGTGAAGQLGIKEVDDYDGDFVAAAASWTKAGTGTSTTYTFELNLDTEELDDLLGVGAAADVASVELNFELEFTVGDTVTSSNTVLLTVDNDVIRGTESGPTDIVAGTPVNGTAQVETATVVVPATVTGDGVVAVVLTGTALTTSPTTVLVEVLSADDVDGVALKIREDIAFQAALSGKYTIGGSGAVITLTAVNIAANDTTLNLATGGAGTTATGITSAPTSVNTTAGVAATTGFLGSMQVDTSFLYVVCAVSGGGVPTWKKIALSTL